MDFSETFGEVSDVRRSAQRPESAKRRVLAYCPRAYSHQWADCWCIYSGESVNRVIGTDTSPAAAWKAAASNMTPNARLTGPKRPEQE